MHLGDIIIQEKAVIGQKINKIYELLIKEVCCILVHWKEVAKGCVHFSSAMEMNSISCFICYSNFSFVSNFLFLLTTQLYEITICFRICICYSLAGIHVESLITTRTVPNTVAERVSCGNM